MMLKHSKNRSKLAALVPKPRVKLTRLHGVFAPNIKYRALVAPATRGKSAKRWIKGDQHSAAIQHAATHKAQQKQAP